MPKDKQNLLHDKKFLRHFYQQFQIELSSFNQAIQGIASEDEQRTYATLMLRRLMVLYFLQGKGLLNNDTSYLGNSLKSVQIRQGKNHFYRSYLLPLFHKHLCNPKARVGASPDMRPFSAEATPTLAPRKNTDLNVPMLELPLFQINSIERNTPHIQIEDDAFTRLFAFFDIYQWRLEEQKQGTSQNELYPEILEGIFEQQINQKQMGAYYTKDDVTTYIARSTILPYLLHTVETQHPEEFAPGSVLWQLLQDRPERYIAETVQSKHYLPKETKWEYERRCTRYHELSMQLKTGKVQSIDDLITYNLDIARFVQDSIAHCEKPALLLAFYRGIAQMSILDPTCGLGAFLLAAANTLEPLYTNCLERMQTLTDRNVRHLFFHMTPNACFNEKCLESCYNTLKKVEEYPTRRHFILSSIINNNLYGVDIMEEATALCKLRLFLALAACSERIEDVPQFSSVKWNIVTGNALVGSTHFNNIHPLNNNDPFNNNNPLHTVYPLHTDHPLHTVYPLHTDDPLNNVYPLNDDDPFNTVGTPFKASGDLSAGISDINNEEHVSLSAASTPETHSATISFDETIHGDEAVDALKGVPTVLEQRQKTGEFHWFAAFPHIMEKGGFDIIVGNPPYIESSKVKREYEMAGYATQSYGNIYAAVVERSLALCRSGKSYLGLIVPLSICGGERFAQLRRMMTDHLAQLWLANFEIFPSRLFDDAFQRLSIVIAQHGSLWWGENGAEAPDVINRVPTICKIYTTRIQRWYAVERPYLIDLMCYTPTQRTVKADVFPKLAAPLQETILHKLVAKAQGQTIASVLYPCKTEHFVYYQEATNYWMKATCDVPYYKKNGTVMEPAHGRFLYVHERRMARVVMAVMNSSLFYVWFATFSDGFHLAHRLVKEFPLGEELYTSEELDRLAVGLEEDIKVHARMSTRNTKSHSIELVEYKMSTSKEFLDEIDTVLGRYYGLNEEELAFVVGYDGKYRMRREE